MNISIDFNVNINAQIISRALRALSRHRAKLELGDRSCSLQAIVLKFEFLVGL